ncbi:Zinc finger MYM-type protein 3 [Collichthys lucidus]|uniref:Zinc finger MYM-type protein 3 n=1 Tax=Collichthys lucidus TaxID=240159 RepID=A0A4U5VLT5_COLLU|nr:Zinc finger MYM-type protein 3 [Collichthys lucidus]
MACSADGCNNRPLKGSGLQFFRFPMADEERLKKWWDNTKKENWHPTNTSRLCSAHFEEDQFCVDERGKKRLKLTAVPTIFDPSPVIMRKPRAPWGSRFKLEMEGQSMEGLELGAPLEVDIGERLTRTSLRRAREEYFIPIAAEKETVVSFPITESEIEDTAVKPKEASELSEENSDKTLEESRAEPDVIEDANMDKASESAENNAEQVEESVACNLRFSTAEDLDEMMDIGTVDQVEQEALMKEDEQNSVKDAESSRSPAVSHTATVTEDSNSFEEDTDDVKPTVLPPPDSVPSNSCESSEAATSTERDSSSPATIVNGLKVVKLSVQSSEKGSQVAKSPSPPLVKVKDEPEDDEYELAQISSTSTASVKDEPNAAKEDLRIGSVYSVTPSAETHALPVVNPSALHMSCSNCKKSLTKGQTAFQRKGSPALFCSTECLTTSLPSVRGVAKICHNCQKLILRPQDVILAPDVKGLMRDFCSQNCLTSFNYKKNATSYMKAAAAAAAAKKLPPIASHSVCSMCSRHCISKHEVILNGAVHKMCSDACFNRFRTVNNLSMAGCANCGSYCHSKPLMLKLEGSNKTLCKADCLAKYKEKTRTTQPCTMCRTTRSISDMIDNKNSDDSVNLFCSSSCVMAFKVQTVSASGARLSCDNCGKNTVPSYHLAMSDTSIRNFCTLPCVMNFQEKFKAQKQLNVFTKLPMGSTTQHQTITAIQPQRDAPKGPHSLSCAQCFRNINFKPELVQIKDKMVFLCSAECSHEFKKAHYVASLCEYCKIEKITREAKRIDNKNCYFCSDGCKLLFRHDLTKSWGKHCHSCVYCHSVSKKLVTAQYGGLTEDFCSEECRSKYTMLFCHVAKCDTCGRKGKLKQSLAMLGEVKHFCDLSCLLQFCCEKVTTQGDVFKGTGEATPIIANVMSLAGPPAGKSTASDKTPQQSTVFQSKNSGHISIQTDAVKAPQPPPGPKILKNKALLCKPLVQNKGVSCKTQTADVEAQTDDLFPKIMVVPVPVPVYVPVPMNMYSQCTPKPLGVPLPLPVPMFLPVAMDSAERIVETIQEIKEKIPSDPFEAELILMAEMIAEQDKNDKDDRPKEKVARQEASAPDDHASNYSDDLDTDDLASFLNNWEDASSDAGLRSPSRPYSNEKLNPILDIPVGMSSVPYSEPPPPTSPPPPPAPPPPPPPPAPQIPPPMDIEADFTVGVAMLAIMFHVVTGTLERMARLREEIQRSPSPPPPPAPSRRRQAPRKAREKKGRKTQRTSKAAEATPQRSSSNKAMAADAPRLKSQYGVDAWKRWIQWRQTQPNLEKPRFSSRPMELKEDVLRCTTAELSYGLCCFINEYLFENGRVENIFMDRFYNKFSTEFTNMLRSFKPSITTSGYIHSRVEEEFLWDCKQLGAYSPIVLLNTLLFFCCKYFGFTTVEQHRQLSFAHVMRCTKTNQDNTKTTFLRFYPPLSINETESDVPAKRRKEEENKEDILEMMENTDNPLRCPVRLYEFYLSKCSESVKQRTNVFYLHPERCCVPNSPLWFSSTPLDDDTMEGMLIRILTVRELHLYLRKDGKKEQQRPNLSPFTPEEEDSD